MTPEEFIKLNNYNPAMIEHLEAYNRIVIQDLINEIEYFGLIKATCRKGYICLNNEQWKYIKNEFH